MGTHLSRAFFSVSASGILAYRAGSGASAQFNWYDREGRVLGRAGEPGEYEDLALSPDAARVAYNRQSQGTNRQIWVLEAARGINTRLTFTPEGARAPAWSPDGTRVGFSSIRGAQTGLYLKDASGSGGDEPIFRSGLTKFLNDWSRDGRFLLYTENKQGLDLWALSDPLGGGERKPIPFANSEFSETEGQFSPDSRWVAYASDESGKFEIYVRPFPPGDGRAGKWLVSSAGGLQPRWRGKELFYVAPDRKLMAVDVKTEPVFQAGAPRTLFEGQAAAGSSMQFRYDVTRDGKRFLMIVAAAGMASAPVTVVLNWEAGLRR